jgi:DNA-binding NarL/FixJ family response regulator
VATETIHACCCFFPHLTTREMDVLDLLALGGTNKQIARKLSLSPQTVAHRVSALLVKFNCPSRSGLIGRAYAAGIWEVGSFPPVRAGRRCVTVQK